MLASVGAAWRQRVLFTLGGGGVACQITPSVVQGLLDYRIV
jgi:hypothetical protein